MKFFLSGGLGDALAITALVREIKKQNPDEMIRVENMPYREIFKHNPNVNWGTKENGRHFFVLNIHEDVGNMPCSFAKQMGFKVVDTTPEIFLTPEEIQKGVELVPQEGTIAIDIRAKSPARRWPWERFNELCELLKREHPVVEVGSRVTDYSGGRELRVLNPHIQLVDRLSIREVAAVLKRCALLISNDSGTMHLAAAVGTPQVVIYSIKRWWSRAYWNTTPVFNLNGCYPSCYETCSNPVDFCMNRIPVKEVHDLVKIAVSRFPRRIPEVSLVSQGSRTEEEHVA